MLERVEVEDHDFFGLLRSCFETELPDGIDGSYRQNGMAPEHFRGQYFAV